SKSGKPCDRLIAPRSAARRDITVKIVVPTFGSLERRLIVERAADSGVMCASFTAKLSVWISQHDGSVCIDYCARGSTRTRVGSCVIGRRLLAGFSKVARPSSQFPVPSPQFPVPSHQRSAVTDSNTPVVVFLRTASQLKCWPFIAT